MRVLLHPFHVQTNMADQTASKRKSNTNVQDKPAVSKQKKFKWDTGMVKLMLDTLYEYKSISEYQNCDFNNMKL